MYDCFEYFLISIENKVVWRLYEETIESAGEMKLMMKFYLW